VLAFGRMSRLPLLCSPFPLPLSVARGSILHTCFALYFLFSFLFASPLHSPLLLIHCMCAAILPYKPRAKSIISTHTLRNLTLCHIYDKCNSLLSPSPLVSHRNKDPIPHEFKCRSPHHPLVSLPLFRLVTALFLIFYHPFAKNIRIMPPASLPFLPPSRLTHFII